MQGIHVSAGNGYQVLIGSGLLHEAGARIAQTVRGRTVMVVSDSHVAPLYLPALQQTLEQAGFRMHSFVFPAGEEQKNTENYLMLLSGLSKAMLTRDDAVVTLGGGVAGDLGGFAAATYLRGVGLVHIPTTLLAMVDASVGGKTAINLPEGKNLCGAFYQPCLVLCDPELLRTLPESIFADGCAEVIKYAMLGDGALLAMLQEHHVREQAEEVIARCIAMKRELVEQDETDRGMRQLLNLGHTFGHAIEAESGFGVSHGQAVAVGMMVITRAAVKRGLCDVQVLCMLEKLLVRYGLPVYTNIPAQRLLERVMADKKRSGDQLALIVPTYEGCRRMVIPAAQALDWLEEGCRV